MSFLVHSGETKIKALVFVGKELGLDTELVEHGCVEVAYVNDVLLGVVAEFIGVPVGDPSFDSSARHPNGKAFDVVVASIPLGHGGASEFSAPNYEGVVEHAPLFEVLNESGGALVHAFGDSCDGVLDATMVIPSTVVK